MPTPRPSAAPAGTPQPTPAPTPPLDARTAALIARLDAWCADLPRNLAGASPPLDIYGALADGRTGVELVQVLQRSKCLLHAAAHGAGDDVVVSAGAYTELGVLLWIDRGFWRIADVPIDFGYLGFFEDTVVEGTREVLFTIASGGSAGDKGVLAVALPPGGASITLHAVLASQLGVRRIDKTHVLVTGRQLPGRPWGIASNCCLPGGHEWLYLRTASGYELAGERQTQDPYFALNALLGAIDAREPQLADDVATPSALSKAAAFFGPGRGWAYRALGDAETQGQSELFRWALLPHDARSTLSPDTVRYSVARYEPAGPTAIVSFERIGDRWFATDVLAVP